MTTPRYRLTVAGPADVVVELEGRPPVARPATAAGETVDEAPNDGVEVRPLPAIPADAAAGSRRFEVLVDGWYFVVRAEPARLAALRERAARAAEAHGVHVGVALRAQIPGRVVRLWIEEGQAVEQGQPLMAIEAMKMENELRAPHAGRVTGLRVEMGKLVERNDELLSIT